MKRFRLPIFLFSTLVVFFSFSHAFAQFTVNNVTPAHGSVNVDLSTTLSVEFSQSLDLAGFDPFESGDFPFEIELHPDSAETENAFPTISADDRTVSLAVELRANTKYTLVVSGAWSATGDSLDKPVVATFTTGAALPAGSISGKITNSGGSSANALVSAFEGAFFDGETNSCFAVSNESGDYTIEFVPPGEYAVFAILDVNGDGDPNPEDGDALGGYDQDDDNFADVFSLNEGEAKTGVDFALENLDTMTANAYDAKLTVAAQAVAADAQAVGIAGADLGAETGKSFFWTYIYYSASLQRHLGFFASSVLCLPGSPDSGDDEDSGFEEFLIDPLPTTRIDSDAALTTALENGGQEFIDANGEVSINVIGMNADPAEFFFGGDDDEPAKRRRGKSFTHLAKKLTDDQRNALAQLEAEPMWMFIFEAAAEPIGGGALEGFFIIGVHMVTGEPIQIGPGFSTAKINASVASATAIETAGDAQLVGVAATSFLFTTPNLNSEGDATFWSFIFHSASEDSFFQVILSNGLVVGEEEIEGWSTTRPVPENFIDSDAAIAVAEAEGGAAIRTADPTVLVEAMLAFGLNQSNPDQLVWLVRYGKFNFGEEIVATFFVDGLTGDVVTNIPGTHPAAPQAFSLSPIYPNPVRVGGGFRVSMQLEKPSQIEFGVYNLLGQEVYRSEPTQLPAGAFTTSIRDLPRGVAAGMYFLRVKATDSTGRVRLLSTRLIVQ